MFNSLRFRLFLSYLLVVAVSVLFIGLALFFLIRSNPAIERIDYLRLNEIVRTTVRRDPPPATTDVRALTEYARRLAADHEARVLFVTRSGAVEIDSDSLDGSPTAGLTQVQPLVGNADRDRGLVRDADGRTWAFLVAPGLLPSGLRLVLLDQRTGPLQFLLSNFLAPLFQSACLGTATSVVMALLIAYWLTSSLRRFSEAASAVAKGDLDHTVPTTGPAEVRSLARSFNDMVARVKASQLAQRDFVANVSHELKTPLTSIAGYAETLTHELPDPSARRFAETILQNAQRMQHLVDDLLDLSRIESGGWQPLREAVDVEPAARDAWAPFAERAGAERIDFTVAVAEHAHTVPADPDALRQMLTNLFDNALRHTPAGGRITVSAALDRDGVILEVRDTGSGIPAEHLSRVFERFYRVDPGRSRDQGGTGLGLAIVKHLVEAHGGRVAVESRLGQGTTIRMRFPAPAPDR